MRQPDSQAAGGIHNELPFHCAWLLAEAALRTDIRMAALANVGYAKFQHDDDFPAIVCNTSIVPTRRFYAEVTTRPLGAFMARPPNYSQDKKRREEAARKKREEKQLRRQQKKDAPVPPTP